VFCFKKTQRLLNKADYDRVFVKAKKLVTAEFIVLFRENTAG